MDSLNSTSPKHDYRKGGHLLLWLPSYPSDCEERTLLFQFQKALIRINYRETIPTKLGGVAWQKTT